MDGTGPQSYGEAFADVYDEWYADVSDTEGTVARLTSLAAGRPVLELGIGTGRLALPLAAAGANVSGIDASPAMVARLAAKPGGDRIDVTVGDMADVEALAPPAGARFGVVFAAFNTLFNLTDPTAQQRCLRGAAARLEPDGCVVVEANVFDPDPEPREALTVRSTEPGRVVLSVSRADPATQTVTGQFVDLVDGAAVRLRPWSLRYSSPEQLDDLAAGAGLTLAARWGGWRGEPFTDASVLHVSVYRLADRS